MNSDKHSHINRWTAVPSIEVDSPASSKRQSLISASSSEESLPIGAPLARQARCSVDIDTIPSELRDKIEANGINKHANAYLDSSELRESIKDIEYVLKYKKSVKFCY